MDEPDLIAETNRLLRTILENDADQRKRADETMAKLKAEREAMEGKSQEAKRDLLRKEGLPEEAIAGTEEEWEARQKEARRRSQERMEEATVRSSRYQEDLLAELRTQSDLLRQIAERLAR